MKCKIPNTPTDAQIEQVRQTRIRENDSYFKFADRLIALSLRKCEGFGHDRFAEFNTSAYELGRGYIDKYAESDKDADEYAIDSYYALRRDLRDSGWDPERKLWRDEVFDTFLPDNPHPSRSERQKYANRLGYVKGISFYVRQQICMAVMWLRNKGRGEIRLDRIFEPVRDDYLELMRQYLRCSSAGDKKMREMYADVRTRYNKMGFFGEIYD